ncbi:MAG: TonB-dependent receptor [Thermodesulfobacteriota bacterium]|nr:TonB-dependent receptor [Thermodesulfobacteriota bacterium]
MYMKILYYIIIIGMIVFTSVADAMAHDNQGHPALSEPSKTVQLDEIVVSGDKIEAFIQQNPHQVVWLDAAEIKKSHFMDAYEALSTLPGVDIKPSTSGGARITIRGSGGSGKVLILIDGRPMNTSQYGSVDLSGIPMDIIKSITVFKPPAPLWLGPGSSAGAICIETKTGAQEKLKNGKYRIALSGGSHGLFDMNCSGKINRHKQNTLIAAGYFHTDGKRENSDKDTGRLGVNWDYKPNNLTQYQINGKYHHTEQGVSGPLYNLTPNARQKYDKGSLDFKVKGLAGEKADYDVKLYSDICSLEDRADAGEVYTLDLCKTGLGSEVVWSNLLNGHDIRLGGFAEYINVDHTVDGEHHRNTLSLHVEHTRRFERITVISGSRGDYTNDFDLSPAADLGVHVRLAQDTILKCNAGYSVNLPSFGQLYQPSHGAIDQVRGNPNLSEEKILSTGLGVDHIFKKDNIFSISLFRTDTDDLIKYQRGVDNISRPDNIRHAYKQGIEASVKVSPLATPLTIDMNYILQETKNEDNDKELSYAPKHHGKIMVKYAFPAKIRLELIARVYSSQFTDTDNTDAEKISGYTTVDAKVIQPLTLFSRSAEFFVHVINLLDHDYELHYGYPDDGFRFIAGLAANF